jgi:hypothetical protein
MTTNLILGHRGLKTAKAAGECSRVRIRCRDSEIRIAESGIRSRCAWLSLDWLNSSLGGPPKVGREDGLDNTLHRGVSSKGLISKRDAENPRYSTFPTPALYGTTQKGPKGARLTSFQ